jgi:hypothetical protein
MTSTEPVSVYAVNKYNLGLDATNVLPTDALGTDYYHISYNVNFFFLNTYDYGQDAMTIVATDEGTTVKYGGNTANLSKGEVLYVPSYVDMTGTYVTSNKPIAYFVTHKSAGIPDYTDRDDKRNPEALFQQLAPVNSWGTHFFVPDIGMPQQRPLLARVVASQDGTKITLDGGTVKSGSLNLNKGEFVTLSISNTGCFVSSTKPVEVCSYLLSYPEIAVQYNRGGPAMAWIPPVEQNVISTTVVPFNVSQSFGADDHYAVIVTPAGTQKETTINGAKTLNKDNLWTIKAGYAYTIYAFPKPTGTVTDYPPYTFSNPNGLTALITGLSTNDGYYYLGGSSMFNLNMMFTINGQHYKDIFGKVICSKDVALEAKILYANKTQSGYLKWYIDGQGVSSATDTPEWKTTLTEGAHTIEMRVMNLEEQTESISTKIVVETPVVEITGPTEIYAGQTTTLESTTGGKWTSSNPAVATVDNNGTVTGVSGGEARFTFTSTNNCSVVSDPVKVIAMNAVNDTVSVAHDNSVNVDASANDVFSCDKSLVILDTVAGSGLRYGSLTINPDKTFTYKAGKGMYGIDSIEYSIACTPNTDKAKIYFVVSRPLSEKYEACENAKFSIGMYPVTGVEYFWYDGDNNLIDNAAKNNIVITKDDSSSQSFYAEVRYDGKALGKIEIPVLLNYDCGLTVPTGCAVDGQLLFREDFGGNSVSDDRISDKALTAGVTDYDFMDTDQLTPNHYTLAKYMETNPTNDRHSNFDDHTSPNNKNLGYMFLVDASDDAGKLYETRITGLCDNMNKLYFSAWVANIVPAENSATADPILRFELSDDDGNVVATYITSTVPRDPKGDLKWRNYGFMFNSQGYASLTLKIYNGGQGSDGNDFAIDDIEVRFCTPPVTMENKSVDTACVAASFTFEASYTDSDGTFTGSGDDLAYHWEYSKNGYNWTIIGMDSTIAATSIRSTYIIDSVTNGDEGYYRFVVGNLSTIDNSVCRIVSSTITLFVSKTVQASDLRILITPSNTQHAVYLTSFIDTLDVASVKWIDPQNYAPKFSDDATGELDAQKLMPPRVYTYNYTVTSKCGVSSAKAYVLTSKDKLPVKNNKEISVCKEFELSKHVQLNQILGLEDSGQWSYPNDTDGIVEGNVTISSSKYAGARIFNAQRAYAEAVKTNSHNYAGNPDIKVFSFSFTSVEGTVYEFTIIVK